MQTLPDTDAPQVADVFAGSSAAGRRVPLERFGNWPGTIIVIGLTLFVFFQLRPLLLFGPNLDVGGDNAAHVVAVYYFVHDLLPHGALSGWDPQWFDGFPLYVFYFPLPAVLVGILNVAFPYNVAFNIVSVLGTLLVPGATYAFGRLAGFRRPIPVLMSVMSLGFLFNTSYTIDGGNVASTMAGEFSFALAIPLGLLFLGYYTRSIRTGRGRGIAAVLFAATVLSHVVPALFFGFAAFVIAVVQPHRRRAMVVFTTTCAAGGLLAGFWLLRFAADLGYSSSMNYQRVGSVLSHYFPTSLELSIQILAIIGAYIGIRRRERLVWAFTLLAIGSIIAFAFLPDGLVYNERWQPFWFLSTALLAGYALGELGTAAFRAVHAQRLAVLGSSVICAVVMLVLLAGNLGDLPYVPSSWKSFVPGWVAWNYEGYQAKTGWTQFQRIVSILQTSAAKYGCGRLDYEYTANATDPFGSTLVEMSFPMWTNGCIDTTEGVYFESSTTNPFHFLDQSELSVSSSDPVSGLPYQPLNVDDGVRHLQLMGVKYFLANSDEVEAQAAADPELVQIASTPATANAIEASTSTTGVGHSPMWILYEIKSAPLVTPVQYLPVIEAGQNKLTWLQTGIEWYQNEAYWSVRIARDGPPNWPSAPQGRLISSTDATRAPATSVSHVSMTNSSISFDVSNLGVPVVVNIPYFPNWQASGATGPYETTPNVMLVVPTSHHVELHYGVTKTDWLGRGASVIGLAGVVALGLRPLAPLPDPAPELTEEAPSSTDETSDDLDGSDGLDGLVDQGAIAENGTDWDRHDEVPSSTNLGQ